MPTSKAERAARIAAGICRRNAAHGPASPGRQTCDACAERKARAHQRAVHPERVAFEANAHTFWTALQDLYFADKWRSR
jgi:hypothetical protein